MTVIEIDDLALRVTRDGTLVCASPSIALVEDARVLTGAAAQARAQWQPRAVYSRFWQQLNDTPLPRPSRACRHHADLAWHHLGAVLDAAGRPSRAALAVPGYYGEAELGLLLGLCAAQGLAVDALVDSAVAALAGVAPRGRYVVCDLTRHHALLTTLDVTDEVARVALEDVPEIGLARVTAAAAELAAGALLTQARCDALHDAASAQRLHDALPGWLAAAREAREVTLTLDVGGREHRARVASREFERVVVMVLQGLLERLPQDARVLLTAPLAALPGAPELLAPAAALPVTAVAAGMAQATFAGAGDGDRAATPYLTRLPACATPTLAHEDAQLRPATSRVPTHVLYGSEAHALDAAPLYLHADGSATRAAHGPAAFLRLTPQGALLRGGDLAVHLNGVAVDAEARVEAGDHITLGAARALCLAIVVHDRRAP
ncbi:MAG: hypothetical protein AB7I01_24175 [Gammaproteobacteria bacterium]